MTIHPLIQQTHINCFLCAWGQLQGYRVPTLRGAHILRQNINNMKKTNQQIIFT